jgi:phospholipid/cholesterol/gamma-HCH transport system substrate-binding protein
VERKANYTAVGAFVILVVAAAFAFVYWYSDGRDRRNYERYEIYFPGSVTGLSEGSSVRYLGVEVGKVRRIRLDSRSPERVQIIADIDQSAPISDTTAANLSMLSLATGLLYIDIRQITNASDLLPAVPSENYPVLNSMRSGFDTVLNMLPEMAGNIARVLQSAQEMFSSENARVASELLHNLHDTSEGLPATMRKLDALLADINETSRQARTLAANLDRTASDLGGAAMTFGERLYDTVEKLEKATDGITLFLEENRSGIEGFTQQGLPQLQRTLESAQDAADELRDLTRGLKENPSQLIYQTPTRGMEVPR